MRVDSDVTVIRLEDGDDIDDDRLPNNFTRVDLEAIKSGDTIVYPERRIVIRYRNAGRMWEHR